MDDLNELMAYGKEFIKYHPAGLKWNPKHIRGVLYDMVMNHVVLVDIEGGKIRGSIGGQVTPNPFDPEEIHLAEMFWWVGEEYRKGLVGLRLMEAFEEVGRILKCTSVVMTTTTLTPTLDKYYKRKGYEHYESTYMRRV